MRNLLLGAALLLTLLVVFAPSATADKGVGVDVGSVEVGTSLKPGRGHYLPRFGVINTGDEATGYELSVGYLDGQTSRRPDQTWFSFDPQSFSLDPGLTREVRVEINLPASAEPGEYAALLRAQTVSEHQTGTTFGVAAATRLSFTVSSTGWLSAQRHAIDRWLNDHSPWVYLVPGVLLLAYLATRVGRVPFRVRVERK